MTTTTHRKRPPRTPTPVYDRGGINVRTAVYGYPPRPGVIRPTVGAR